MTTDEMQVIFMPVKGTIDNVFTLIALQENIMLIEKMLYM